MGSVYKNALKIDLTMALTIKNVRNVIKPIHFSEHFVVNKAALSDLGVFDPILNYDTKVFVEPLLLKTSTAKIIQQSYKTYKEFFAALLLLLKNSKASGDKCWRAAPKDGAFP